MRPLLLALLVPTLLACPPARGDDDDDDDTSEAWTVELDNQAANTFSLLLAFPCGSMDPSDQEELPLPAGGLAPGASARRLLETPGCWGLSLEGEGCYASAETGELEAGGQYVWTLTDADLSCIGG